VQVVEGANVGKLSQSADGSTAMQKKIVQKGGEKRKGRKVNFSTDAKQMGNALVQGRSAGLKKGHARSWAGLLCILPGSEKSGVVLGGGPA